MVIKALNTITLSRVDDGAPGSKDVPFTYVQTAQPTGTIVKNSLWWVGASLATVTSLKRWNGTAWASETIDQSVINIKTLNAIIVNGGTLNGTTFNTSYTKMPIEGGDGETGSYATGTGQLDNELTFYGTIDTTHTFSTSYGPTGLVGVITNKSDGHVYTFGLSALGGLSLHDGDFHGTLDARALTKTPWQTLPLNAGYQASEGRTPQYKTQYNLDGTRTIKFRGQVTTTNAPLPDSYFVKDTEYYVATIPKAVAPKQTSFTYAATGANVYVGARVAAVATSTPGIQVLVPHANVNYVVLDSLEYTID